MAWSLQSPSFELHWDSQRGRFRLESPGRSLEGVAGVVLAQQSRHRTLATDRLTPGRVTQDEIQDAHGAAQEMAVHYQGAQGMAMSLRIRLYPARPFVLFRVSVTNVGHDVTQVRRFFIRTLPDGFLSIEPPTAFFANGWQSWSPAGAIPASRHAFVPKWLVRRLQGPVVHNARTPWSRRAGRFWSETVGAIVTPREALVAGAASLADQFAQVWGDLRPGHCELLVQSQADDVPLAVGESLNSEWFYLEWVPIPNTDPLAQYAHAVARQMALPKPRPAPAGWCSWYIYGNKVAEADVMKNMATAALLADELPLQVIQVDDGYQKAWGDWTECNERFPHGLPWLADRIRGSGFTPGLWLAPLIVHPKSAVAREHPGWLLRKRRGRPVAAGLVSGAVARALDPTHPGVQRHLRDLVNTVVHEWGYAYLKLDFMYAGALPGQRYNAHLTRAQALRDVYALIREAAGAETYVVGCGGPLAPAVGLVDAMRIGPDTSSTWGPNFGWVGRMMKSNPSMPGLRNSLRNVMARAWMHERWWTNDPDTLLMRDTRTELTEAEVMAQLTMLGLSGGLMLLSDALDQLPAERRAMAAKLLPPLLDGMDVLSLLQEEMPEAVVVPVARSWGRWRLVGLFNWRDEPVERTLPAHLTFDERRAYHIVDFWERRYLRLEPGAASPVFHLPAHGAALLGVRPIKPEPHVVATTYHISQGGEIERWRAEPGALTLTLQLERLAEGEVWLALPGRPAAEFNGQALPDRAIRAISPGIWAVRCPVNRRGELRVTWEPA